MQRPDGSFFSCAGSDRELTANIRERQTIFITATILISLRRLSSHAGVQEIAADAIRFLMNNRRPGWTWNYWPDNSEGAMTLQCPDDLDDTFSALTALHIFAPEQISPDAVAGLLATLKATEETIGGPYNTWIIDTAAHPAWKDIDPIANSAVAYFLSRNAVSLPAVNDLIIRAIRHLTANPELPISRYYDMTLPVLYFLSRVPLIPDSHADHVAEACTFIREQRTREEHWGNPLLTACALTALASFGQPLTEPEAALRYLTESAPEGVWKASSFYIETTLEGMPTYAGSSALSTALCLEALAAYEVPKLASAAPSLSAAAKSHGPDRIEREVMESFLARFAPLGAMQESARILAEAVRERDGSKQIALLPYHFAHSLSPAASQAERIEELSIELGRANLAGWIAYRIYDDFLDDEGIPDLIPLASVCLREASAIYTRRLPPAARHIFGRFMDRMDAALAWQRRAARFNEYEFLDPACPLPDYGDQDILADITLPQCLGPITYLARRVHGNGQAQAADDLAHAELFFRHYLIARQLSVDIIEWPADLERGCVTPCAIPPLQAWRAQPENDGIPFSEALPQLIDIFWQSAIRPIAELISTHLNAARRALSHISCLAEPAYLESLLIPLEQSTSEALERHQKMISAAAALAERRQYEEIPENGGQDDAIYAE